MDNRPDAHLVLDALAQAIATLAAIPRLAPPDNCELWAHVADEARVAEGHPYTVLRAFGALPVDTTPNAIAVQATTYATPAFAALERAAAVFGALLASDGDGPRQAWTVGPVSENGPTWLVDVFEPEEPRHLGNDDRGRAEVVSNFILAYRRIPAQQQS